MRPEIGSEFWTVPISESNCLFGSDTRWFISGRSALQAIIDENQFQSVALPNWCCESMIRPFKERGIKVIFYQALNSIGDINADAAVVMDYFGYTGYSDTTDFKGVVIRDTTHSLLSAKYDDADYYFGSLRKWAGFWTGGYAWGFRRDVSYSVSVNDYVDLRREAAREKECYINELTNDKNYLKLFETAEGILESVGIHSANQRDVELAKKLDVELIKEKRRKNASMLLNEFSKMAIFPKLNENDCPMFVPIRIKRRNELRHYLMQHEIYCPVHWPISSYHNLSEEAVAFYNDELSLVCDQRYTEKDMFRIVQTIQNFINKEN